MQNEPVPDPRRPARLPAVPSLVAPLAAAALALATLAGLVGCSTGSDAASSAASSSSASSSSSGSASGSASPSPSSTVSVPARVSLTAGGSRLSYGDAAKVVFESTRGRGTVLRLTVEGVRRGRIEDFKGFILDDPYKKRASYYYAKVKVTNIGGGDVGGVPVPLWGVNAENVLLPAVNFTTTFRPCPSRPLPATFGPHARLSTCLVFLSPDHGALTAVSYRPSQAFNPITWRR